MFVKAKDVGLELYDTQDDDFELNSEIWLNLDNVVYFKFEYITEDRIVYRVQTTNDYCLLSSDGLDDIFYQDTKKVGKTPEEIAQGESNGQ